MNKNQILLLFLLEEVIQNFQRIIITLSILDKKI